MAKALFEVYLIQAGDRERVGYKYSNYYKQPTGYGKLVLQDLLSFAQNMSQGVNRFDLPSSRYIKVKYNNGNNIYSKELTIENGYWEWVEQIGNQTPTRTKITAPYGDLNIPSKEINIEGSDNVLIIEYLFDGTTEGWWGLLSYSTSVNLVENRYRAKPWTMLDVINRTLDLIEPLKYGQKPRFRLKGVIYDDETGNAIGYEKGSIAEKYDKILSPEFAFTKMTLREQLKQIGGFIHAEPRISRIVDDGTEQYFEVVFDEYGSNRVSTIKDLKQPITQTLKTNENDYCTSLDSTADNLVNALDYAQGVVTVPFENGGISLRTDTVTVRIEDNNSSFVPTPDPIDQVVELDMVGYIAKRGDSFVEVPKENQNITAHLYESADYGLLSSYSGAYPYAKAFALEYTQGQKGIRGLFFRQENAVDTSFYSRYAIVNILRSVMGDNSIDIDEKSYPTLVFRIKYKPFYKARIKTNKSLIVGGLPSSLAYEQGANMIESRYYGENLKGVVARLGNVEKQLTYILAFISDIPRIGDLYDKNYYISAVSVEYLPTYIKCTIGLSKDFNRLSQYVGINSQKRMWEISEKMSQNRETTVTEYVVISKEEQQYDENVCYTGNTIAELLLTGWENGTKITAPISAVECKRYNKKITKYTGAEWVTLPVISSSFGNSMAFTFRFEDNYSAGQRTEYIEQDGIKGIFGNYVPYGDYNGKFYWLSAEFETSLSLTRSLEYTAQILPLSDAVDGLRIFKFDGNTLLKYRKDNRETPQITYQLTAVTNNENIVIGSGLMRNCRLVSSNPNNIVCVGFYDRLNTIDSTINVYYDEDNNLIVENGYDISPYTLLAGRNSIKITNKDKEIKSWALVAAGKAKTITVEDDDGDIIGQLINNVGEIVLGENIDLKPNESSTVYFSVKSNIYDII